MAFPILAIKAAYSTLKSLAGKTVRSTIGRLVSGKVATDFHPEIYMDAVREALGPQMVQMGKIIEQTAKASMRQGANRRDVSPPGTPPNKQTGTLHGSISSRVGRNSFGELTVTVDSETKNNRAWYGMIHEYGGTFRVKAYERRIRRRGFFSARMFAKREIVSAHTRTYPPRPFIGPAVNAAIAKMPQLFKDLDIEKTRSGRRLKMKTRSVSSK